VQERIWRRPGQSYLRPFTQELGLKQKGLSRLLQRRVCDFAWNRAFAKAAQQLREHYGFELPVERIRQSSLEHAHRIDGRALAEGPATVLKSGGADLMVAEADGSMIRLVENGRDAQGRRTRQLDWHECRLCAVAEAGSAQPQYAASFAGVETLGRLWSRCAQRANWGTRSVVQTLGDGAPWIDHQSAVCFGAHRWYLLDFYHVVEYLAAASESCALKESPKRWLGRQATMLKKGKAAQVIANLKKRLEPQSTSEEEAPVRAAWRYLKNRIDSLDYPRAIALGLPIGTGMIESANGHVVQDRLKGRGMAWLPQNAQALAQARAFTASGRWDQYWEKSEKLAA
jgi:hypothetical protein